MGCKSGVDRVVLFVFLLTAISALIAADARAEWCCARRAAECDAGIDCGPWSAPWDCEKDFECCCGKGVGTTCSDNNEFGCPYTCSDTCKKPEEGGGGDEPEKPVLKSNGESCSKGAQCKSGFCVNGICCNGACLGSCESCSEPGSVGKCISKETSCLASSSDGISWTCSKNACCEFTSCVDNSGGCRAIDNYHLNTNAGGNDNTAACLLKDNKPTWVDCDNSNAISICASVCGGSGGVYAGEVGVGEYSDLTRKMCCGDDKNEFLKKGNALLQGSTPVCCSRATDCVDKNGKCMDDGTILEGMMCSGGVWSYPRLTWDGAKLGACPESNQCLVDPSGDSNLNNMPDSWYQNQKAAKVGNATVVLKGPRCISEGQFILDHLCSQGRWTTRTGIVAGTLVSDQPGWETGYTLFCGNYSEALNHYRYPLGNMSMAVALLESNGYCGNFSCLNSFCVLMSSDGSLKGVGGSLNLDRDYEVDIGVLGMAFGVPNVSCPNNQAKDSFESCGSSGLKFNAARDSFVYVPKKQAMVDGSGFMARLGRIIVAPFNTLFGAYKNANPKDTAVLSFIQYDAADFDKLYIYRVPEKSVFGVQDSQNMTERIMMNFTGFESDLCGELKAMIPKDRGNCTKTGTSQLVLVRRIKGENSRLFEYWQDMTAALRVQ